ncbi:S-layer homology domain-containing protein [Paenibacillus sp. Soil724D2]|uniref:S-layer homology domain-containing protein n=1 Tax=Paenibacillus sp. (strain Soil724D2) TaxID=1736392 RepID=UPI000714D6C8|nr:S-layer homology domain-containing protein [Paenibacillus sp. Soil724D2]KRE50741.1 hypothetical protein ASG85_19410 [Paenibacillus sp. Soil724D2]
MKKILPTIVSTAMLLSLTIPALAEETNQFSDITNSFAKDAIIQLQKDGVLTGMDAEHFDPKGTLTRAQFVTILVKALKLQIDNSAVSSFTDVEGWAVPYVEAAKKYGIIDGMGDGTFAPNGTVTREQTAVIMVKALQKQGKIEDSAELTFTDADKVSDWAKKYVALALKYKLVSGNPDGSFNPQGNATREQAAQMGSNFIKGAEEVKDQQKPETPQPTPSTTPAPSATPAPSTGGGGGGSTGGGGGGNNTTPATTSLTITAPNISNAVQGTQFNLAVTMKGAIESDHANDKVRHYVAISGLTSSDIVLTAVNGVVPVVVQEGTATLPLIIAAGSADGFRLGDFVSQYAAGVTTTYPVTIKKVGNYTFNYSLKTVGASPVSLVTGASTVAVQASTTTPAPVVVDGVSMRNLTQSEVAANGKTSSGGIEAVVTNSDVPDSVKDFKYIAVRGSSNERTNLTLNDLVLGENERTVEKGNSTTVFNWAFSVYSLDQEWFTVMFYDANKNPIGYYQKNQVVDFFPAELGSISYLVGKGLDDVLFAEDVARARERYEELNEQQKALVSNYNVLLAAEALLENPTPATLELTAIGIFSSNANDKTIAVKGDTVSVLFLSTEETFMLDTFKINGKNPTSFTSELKSGKWLNQANYVLDGTEPEGLVTFKINVKNSAGTLSKTIETTTIGGSVTVVVPVVELPDTTAIDTAIAAANAAKANVEISVNGSDVEVTSKWVTEEVNDALVAAITAATTAKATATTALQVTNAAAALDAAVVTYNAAKTNGTKVLVDTTALDQAIIAAEIAKQGVAISVNGTEVPVAFSWVTKEVCDVLDAAIATAKLAKTNATTTQQVTDAVIELNDAVLVYSAEVKNGTYVAPVLDTTVIDTAISNANTIKMSFEISTNGNDVIPAAKWVTQTDFNTLQAVILAATTVKNNAATQQELDDAVTSLNLAVETFTAAAQSGTKPPTPLDTTLLDEEITKAQLLPSSVQISLNGSDVDPAKQWVTTEVNETLLAAITAAQNAKSAATTQHEITVAVTDLSTAQQVFESARAFGTKVQLDTTSLELSIQSATLSSAAISVSENGLDIPTTKYWVTEDVMNTFNAAIQTATDVKTNADTQQEIDNAIIALQMAQGMFSVNQQKGTLADPTLTTVATAEELATALTDTSVKTIKLSDDITLAADYLMINRAVTIDGGNYHSINKGIAVEASNVIIKNIQITPSKFYTVEGFDWFYGVMVGDGMTGVQINDSLINGINGIDSIGISDKTGSNGTQFTVSGTSISNGWIGIIVDSPNTTATLTGNIINDEKHAISLENATLGKLTVTGNTINSPKKLSDGVTNGDGITLPNGAPETAKAPVLAANFFSGVAEGSEVVIKVAAVLPVTISNISITSSNADPRYAVTGDTVTLTFRTAEQVTKLGSFKINDNDPTDFTSVLDGSDYLNTATYTITDSDLDTLMTFKINVQNASGVSSATTEATTDNSKVQVLKAAIISNVHIESNNADTTKAAAGDTVTLTFTSSQGVWALNDFLISGKTPTTFNLAGDFGGINTVTYVLDGTDLVGLMTFQINVKNVAGLNSAPTAATTDSSSVTVITSTP